MIPEGAEFHYGQMGELQRILNEAFEDEHAFNLQGSDKIRLGWMPFQMADFIGIMSEVIREADGPVYLEVGSGIGTKMMVARYLFGLFVGGIEYSETLATVAKQKHRGPVTIADALTIFEGAYSLADIIWMYRCFRDPVLQRQLEERIYAEAKPGAIFAGAHLEHVPPGWITVVDDIDVGNRGAWKRP
jgi:hypothetical protein